MSNDREKSAEERRLADTYKSLANERAPEYLNKRVLRLAAGHRTPYFRARVWMRPVAWAATIGLSLAIVLEISRLPQAEPDYIGILVPDDNKAGDPKLEINDRRATEAKTIAPKTAIPVEQTIDAKRSRPGTPTSDRADRLPNDEFAPKNMTVLRDAEDMARARAGSDQGPTASPAELDEVSVGPDLTEEMETGVAPAEPVATESIQAGAEKGISRPACAVSVRKQPESWFDCIRTLEENGREDEARREYEEFRRVFPDFDDRDADR